MTDVVEIEDWTAAWIREKSRTAEARIAPDIDFIEAGMLDSITLVQLVCSAEERFGIRFNEGHFAERDFQTVGGFSRIVATLQQNKTARPGPRR